MAGVFDADIQAATELIALYGAVCGWQKAAPEVEVSPGYVEAGVLAAPIPCKIAFFSGKDLGLGSEAFLAALAGTEVPVGQEVGLLAGGIAFTPEMPDSLIRGGETLTVKRIDRLAPNGTPVLYYITVAP